MTGHQSADYLTIINGPEDGTQFAIIASPLLVGTDARCVANIRLDPTVQREHARLTPVASGYRVRSITPAPVYVNGKRVGQIRSRVLLPGGELKIGHTLLALECGEEGLASQASAVDSENDLVYAVRNGISGLSARALYLLQHAPKKIVVAALVILYLFVPPFRHGAHTAMESILSMTRRVFLDLFN